MRKNQSIKTDIEKTEMMELKNNNLKRENINIYLQVYNKPPQNLVA